MTSLVRNTQLRFSKRVDGYEPLDQIQKQSVDFVRDDGSSHSGRRITIMKLQKSRRHQKSPIMLSSFSYRRERARKRHIFLQSYKLESSESLRNRKLKKILVKVKTAMVSVLSFMRIHTMKSCNSRSAIRVASPAHVIRIVDMFDILFGWRNATKCKNLIKRVKCRLKLLKNKRSCIVRQLRDDLGELFRHGHYQIVFDRVEQLFMDENLVVVYDLLDNFCEFILINLPYIRRHKDCPNDINEAVSSLIFASARLGDLPELLVIRKLFRERYGKKFETSALELPPGNLVNAQIKDNLRIKSVSDEVKHRLVDEIARSCFQKGPLLLEYRNESQEEQVHKTIGDAQTDYTKDGETKLKNSNIATEAKIVSADYSSPAAWPCVSFQSAISSPEPAIRRDSRKKANEMIYLDEIEEFESILSKDLNFQDQRLFMFKAPLIPLMLKLLTDSKVEGLKKQFECMNVLPVPKTKFITVKDASAKDRLENFDAEVLVNEDCCSFTFSSPAVNDLSPRKENQHDYLRTMTMPPERTKDNLLDNFLRSNSFQVQEPGKGSSLNGHVHPKLPDYDEIAAKFIALKKEKLQNKC